MPEKDPFAAAVAEAIKPLTEHTSRISKSLSTLASIELARTLYERTELLSRIKEYAQLCKADSEAFDAMTRANTELEEAHGSLSWEQRVEKFGVVDAEAQRKPADGARQARVATMNAVDTFALEHPVVVAIVQASRKGDQQ